MNQEQRRNVLIGVLVVGLIGAGAYLYMGLQPDTSGYELPPTATGGDSAGPPTGAAAAAGGGTSGVALVEDDINVEDLLLAVQDVTFDYRSDRMARNPMTPLVGRVRDGATGQSDRVVVEIPILQRAKSMLLTAILWDDKLPLAVLDNNVVEEGHVFFEDMEGGITVTKIEPERVTLTVQEQPVLLEIEEQ